MKRSRLAGLNPSATALVANAVSVENIGSISAVWYSLKRYTMPDGKKYTEYQQAAVDSITWVYFLALKDGDGNNVEASLWDSSQMKTW